MSNVDRYLEFMSEASQAGADIIVFPEYGVSGVGVSEVSDRDRAREFMVVGEVDRDYCGEGDDVVNNNDEVMRMLACGAQDNQMYLVINIGEMVNCTKEKVSTFKQFLLNENCLLTDRMQS